MIVIFGSRASIWTGCVVVEKAESPDPIRPDGSIGLALSLTATLFELRGQSAAAVGR